MKSIRPQLDQAKLEYLATGYPGDLASEVLGGQIGLPAPLSAQLSSQLSARRGADDTDGDAGADSSAHLLRQRWWWAGAGSAAAAAVLTLGFFAARGPLPSGNQGGGTVAGTTAYPQGYGPQGFVAGPFGSVATSGNGTGNPGTLFVVNPNPFLNGPAANTSVAANPNITTVGFGDTTDRSDAASSDLMTADGMLSARNFNGMVDPAFGPGQGIVFGPSASGLRIGTPVMPMPPLPVSRFQLFAQQGGFRGGVGYNPNVLTVAAPSTQPAALAPDNGMTLQPGVRHNSPSH